MWWINTGMPKQISLVLGPQELREWLAPWSVLAAESTLCDSWKSVSSPEQEWAKSDLFLKYLLSLKNNSSFQLMLPDCCSPPPLFFFFFVCLCECVCQSLHHLLVLQTPSVLLSFWFGKLWQNMSGLFQAGKWKKKLDMVIHATSTWGKSVQWQWSLHRLH